MVDSVKISQLPSAVTPLTGAEVAPLVQSGVTTKASVADVVRVVPTSILPNGMFVPASNTLAFSTDTTERMRIDSTGNVGIGTTSPSAKLTIVDSSSSDALRITQTGAGNALVVEDTASPDSTPFVVNADGVVVVGAQVPYNTVTVYGTSITPAVNVVGGTFGGAAASISNWSSSGINLPSLVFSKSKSGAIGSQGVVANGDDLGAMSFTGSDGTNFVNAAAIRAQVDGTPGTNDMPGRLTFSTTADGASSPTERMRIDSSGNVGVGVVPSGIRLDVFGANNLTFAPNVITTRISGSNSATSGSAGAGFSFRGYTTGTTTLSDLAFISGIKENTTDTNYAGALVFGTRLNGSGGGSFERLRIDSSGNVGIGTASPSTFGKFAVVGSGDLGVFSNNANSDVKINVGTSLSSITNSVNAALAFGTNNTERMRITSAGRVLIGSATTYSSSSAASPVVQVVSAGANLGGFFLQNATASGTAPAIYSTKTRSGTIGDYTTAVIANDSLLFIAAEGSDGVSALRRGGAIGISAEATFSATSAPSYIYFSTTPSGSVSSSERMRIDSSGNVGIGVTPAGTGALEIKAGTTTVAPLGFNSGTNLTTPVAGAMEYDGTVFTATSNTNFKRGTIPLTNYASGTGTTLTTNGEATLQNLLPAANDTITLSSGTYFMNVSFIVTRGASTTSATARLNILGSGGAAGNFSGMSLSAPTAGGTTGAFSFDAVNINVSNVLTDASTTSGGVYTITLRGILKITTGGTIVPQYNLSANINGAGTVAKVLYFNLTQLDSQNAAASGPAGTGWG